MKNNKMILGGLIFLLIFSITIYKITSANNNKIDSFEILPDSISRRGKSIGTTTIDSTTEVYGSHTGEMMFNELLFDKFEKGVENLSYDDLTWIEVVGNDKNILKNQDDEFEKISKIYSISPEIDEVDRDNNYSLFLERQSKFLADKSYINLYYEISYVLKNIDSFIIVCEVYRSRYEEILRTNIFFKYIFGLNDKYHVTSGTINNHWAFVSNDSKREYLLFDDDNAIIKKGNKLCYESIRYYCEKKYTEKGKVMETYSSCYDVLKNVKIKLHTLENFDIQNGNDISTRGSFVTQIRNGKKVKLQEVTPIIIELVE